jgi:predicted hydrocarbon binding protein
MAPKESMEQLAEVAPDGVMSSKATGARIFVLSAKAWSQIERQLFSTFSTGASIFLVHLGEYYGRAMVREAKVQATEPEGAAKILAALSSASGWGELSVKGSLKGDTTFTVEMRNCVFCSQASQLRSCYFLLGVVAGAAGEIYGKQFEATEHQCGHNGSDVCRMAVEPVEPRDGSRLVSAVTHPLG